MNRLSIILPAKNEGESLADLLPNEQLTPRKSGDLCARLTGTRVLIILDEFDRAESASFRRDIAEACERENLDFSLEPSRA